MKTRILFALLLGSLAVAASPANQKNVSLTGWVSDEHCGAQHTKPGGAGCIRKCIKGGADVGHPEWKPQRMVFVSEADKKVWVVENPETLKGREGQKVKIRGRIDARKKAILVIEAEATEKASQ